MLVKFCTETVEAVDAAASNDQNKFTAQWNMNLDEATEASGRDFVPIKKQYDRMIQSLPKTHAEQWKRNVGLLSTDPSSAANDVTEENESKMKENDDGST
jgi:hypothetical protein